MIEKIHMDYEKSLNLFEIKKDRLPDYLLNNYFDYQFVNNFLALLLCKILDFFDMANFFKFMVISQNTEIPIESNYCFRMYVLYIFKVTLSGSEFSVFEILNAFFSKQDFFNLRT